MSALTAKQTLLAMGLVCAKATTCQQPKYALWRPPGSVLTGWPMSLAVPQVQTPRNSSFSALQGFRILNRPHGQVVPIVAIRENRQINHVKLSPHAIEHAPPQYELGSNELNGLCDL